MASVHRRLEVLVLAPASVLVAVVRMVVEPAAVDMAVVADGRKVAVLAADMAVADGHTVLVLAVDTVVADDRMVPAAAEFEHMGLVHTAADTVLCTVRTVVAEPHMAADIAVSHTGEECSAILAVPRKGVALPLVRMDRRQYLLIHLEVRMDDGECPSSTQSRSPLALAGASC